jgi:outer membrane lipoprotein SlyB
VAEPDAVPPVRLNRPQRAAIGAAVGGAVGGLLALMLPSGVAQAVGLALAVLGAVIGRQTAPWGCGRCAVRLPDGATVCPGCRAVVARGAAS